VVVWIGGGLPFHLLNPTLSADGLQDPQAYSNSHFLEGGEFRAISPVTGLVDIVAGPIVFLGTGIFSKLGWPTRPANVRIDRFNSGSFF